jgi:histone deacetylase HOS3
MYRMPHASGTKQSVKLNFGFSSSVFHGRSSYTQPYISSEHICVYSHHVDRRRRMSQVEPIGLFIQPACLLHKYIRHSNSSHIFERPERLRAVLLGVAAAAARLEQDDEQPGVSAEERPGPVPADEGADLTSLLSSLSIASSSTPTKPRPFALPRHLTIVAPPLTASPGQILLHHPALQLSHTPPPEAPFPYLGTGASDKSPSYASAYMRDLLKWATEAPERIKTTGCEIPSGLGLNQGDLYLGPGSVLAIEGAVSGIHRLGSECEHR